MKKNRRDFLKTAGMTGIGVAGLIDGLAQPLAVNPHVPSHTGGSVAEDLGISLIGQYGPWAASLNENRLPAFSFRRPEFTDVNAWRRQARERLADRLAIPDIGGTPKVTVHKTYTYDGLEIQELSWQLPYGRPTEAILMKPKNAKGKLPAIVGLHDHAGLKYFGKRKITKTGKEHPMMKAHHEKFYGGVGWANEIAKRGYVVLSHDAFPFASRRVMLKDVPEGMRRGLNDNNPEDPENIRAYNRWAGGHESTMAKSLFSAGTTWPGVYLAEDMKAVDVLIARDDVDADNIGCAGLSGGGMRTVYLGGYDHRVKCAVCVGFMSTWKDFVLNRSSSHTWMAFAPLLPNDLDFPEILSVRAPLPTMVLSTTEDHLYTLEGMKAADKILQEVYAKAGASDHYKGPFHPGPHKFDLPMQKDAFDWFDRWLKK